MSRPLQTDHLFAPHKQPRSFAAPHSCIAEPTYHSQKLLGLLEKWKHESREQAHHLSSSHGSREEEDESISSIVNKSIAYLALAPVLSG